jgi:hypothetical protein
MRGTAVVAANRPAGSEEEDSVAVGRPHGPVLVWQKLAR